jgi:elongator complex protein 4
MSFRKRNVVISSPGNQSPKLESIEKAAHSGTRPSPLDGRWTTSTGTRSLDKLLAGHAGLALGSSLLIEEVGTTDFGGALLRYYAAEGLVQHHIVHVLGATEAWSRELPGLTNSVDEHLSVARPSPADKMRIAWRYERLGEFGRGRDSQLYAHRTGHLLYAFVTD